MGHGDFIEESSEDSEKAGSIELQIKKHRNSIDEDERISSEEHNYSVVELIRHHSSLEEYD